MFPDRAKWAPQGPRRAKYVRSGRVGSPINHRQVNCDCICAMDSFDAFTIDPEHAAIRAVDRPRFSKRFFRMCYQLTNCLWEIFRPSSRWPRGTVNMQSIEMVAIWVAACDFRNSFGGRFGHPRTPQEGETVPCTALRSSARPRNRSTAFLQ